MNCSRNSHLTVNKNYRNSPLTVNKNYRNCDLTVNENDPISYNIKVQYKHETSTQCWSNVGPLSATLPQQQPIIRPWVFSLLMGCIIFNGISYNNKYPMTRNA